MDNNKGMIGMALGSWLIAFAAGTLAGTLLWVLGGWSFLQGAFVGFIVFIVVGAVVSWIMTRPLPAPGEIRVGKPSSGAKAQASDVAPAVTEPKPAKAAPAPAPAEKPAAQPEAAKVTEKKAEPKPAQASTDARPTLMQDAPDGGTADDLKKISGVGPKLEQTLNDLGIWHYSQIAKFKKKDIAWVDERLRFKGRIERDDWIGQAKELAKAKG